MKRIPYLKTLYNYLDRLAAEAARPDLCEVVHQGTSGMEGVKGLQLQQRISDMVMLETYACSL